ncbi:hypothetical protein B0A48_10838 [Cryoendolithus antarcticus]|uniref:Vacuolar protein sorting/targeting protein 10 n=1 Tax=Cryoendolithus antarcticus TaxID=1507870 RepID=A0A1V8SYJ2_9PEZI|nr:hypothetical protein B0A48_10838 [Cryoendolithus antarcticus]
MHRRPGMLVSLVLGFLSVLTIAKKDKPSVESTTFKSIPAVLTYFDDTDIILVVDTHDKTTYRSDDAGIKWAPLSGVAKGETLELLKNQNDPHVAVVIGTDKTHWITKDQGKSWDEFETEFSATMRRPAIAFHASDPDRMLFEAAECTGLICHEKHYYTTDGFKTKPKPLRDDAMSCMWAKSDPLFTSGDKKIDSDRVLCNVAGKYAAWEVNTRLLISDDFFKDDEFEPAMEKGRPVPGVVNIAPVKSYLVAAAKSEGSRELAMYVSDDSKTWHPAEFGTEHKLEQDAYTLLESTNYSMQVDVMTTSNFMPPMGVLYTSNSNGTFFTKNIEHTNRNKRGFVDFEKISNIQGIVMVNTVKNWESVELNPLATKELITQISFDDGRTWQPMQSDGKDLHLHSVTNQRNIGRVYSSPAPGIVMGVGNTGKSLKPREECDTWVSDDAGIIWTRALRGPHLYEFGDQGALLVAIEDGEAEVISWSLDHGKKWQEMKLPDKVRPISLTTTPDSTSLKFILTADKGKGAKTEHQLLAFDFADLHERKCEKKDFEDWYARVDEKGEPTCIMGHTQMYRRRKADAECFVDKEFEDPEPLAEDCKCTDDDYECDYNFVKSGRYKCEPSGPLKAPEGVCKDSDDTFEGSSGFRLIPGNTCSKRGGLTKDEPVKRKCGETKAPPASGKIGTEISTFKGDRFIEYYYLERCASCKGEDETVIMRTDRREVFLTRDHGKTWAPILKDEEIVAIYPHMYSNDRVYMITPKKKVFYSEDRGKTIGHFDTPEAPNQDHLQILSFHPKADNEDWLIWTGGEDCGHFGADCKTISHVTTRNGLDWKPLLEGVRKCQFVWREDRPDSDKLVYCEQYDHKDPEQPLNLLSSSDWFETNKKLKRDVISFATMAEYIVVAVRDEDKKSLKVDTSIDGIEFADAQFPSNFKVPHQQAYTVLDSSTHAVFLHVTVNNKDGSEYGSIIKSNSNGTSYVLSIGQVNRNGAGYVDFEKMQGLEGVAVVNVVANAKEADGGSAKKLKTMITHNDGAEWAYIRRPKDPKGTKVDWCKGDSDKCSLHIHGYTERDDPRDTFSSPSAVGLMLGIGNVGEFLGYKKDADTFITRDGGINWNMVNTGTWMWEYGDQGSIIVIVKKGEPVKEVQYTLDEGITWIPFQFSKDPMVVDDISTVPSDTSRNFLLWGKVKGDLTTINLDFSGLEERSKQCVLSEQDPEADDYYLWMPSHPLSEDNCLFGHVAQYHRKLADHNCYNGRSIEHLHTIGQNCTCSRQDFECDYNFERQPDNTCRLVEGLSPPDPQAMCAKDKSIVEYYDTTGYRRIPLTTCAGGRDLEFTSRTRPCPGKEEEFNSRHGISAAGLFFAITIPIALASAAGYWVWRNWDGKFGRIQLGDGSAGSGSGAFDRDAPWIKFPVLAISAIVAVLAALPMVAGSLYRTVATRFGRGGGGRYGPLERPYTSRGSFARGRGGYSVVDEEDEDFLGGEEDEA